MARGRVRLFVSGSMSPQDQYADDQCLKDENQEKTTGHRVEPAKEPLLRLGDPAIRSAEGPRPVETEPKANPDQRYTNSRGHGQRAGPPPIKIDNHSAIILTPMRLGDFFQFTQYR